MERDDNMEYGELYAIGTFLVFLSSVISAITVIYTTLKKPAKRLKERQKAELKENIKETVNEVMPNLFLQHDLETREKYLSDREKYLRDICEVATKEVLSAIDDKLKNLDYVPKLIEVLDTVVTTEKNTLRIEIIKIYTANRAKRSLSTLDRERLEQFYTDYKALKGNSYIDKYYNRMKKWKTLGEKDDIEDDII